jgi:hypothetical protein
MPRWRYTIDVSHIFHDDGVDFEPKRDAVVKILRQSKWFRDYGDDLEYTLEHLSDSEDVEEFDMYWDDLYDLADVHRAWIQTYA